MSARSIERIVHRSIIHTAAVVMIILTAAGCGQSGPTATPVPATTTRIALEPTHTPLPPTATPMPPMPTDTLNPPTETATPAPTATPMPTATAAPTPAATEAPAFTLYPEPGLSADVRIYGRQYHDRAFDLLVTEDGGSLIAGLTNNLGLSHRITPGNAWLVRTDAQGTVLWKKEYGGEQDASFSTIIQVGQEEYVLLGEIAASYERDETDVYLVKVDGQGNEIWSHTFGGRGMDFGKMVRQTADGGYIVIGSQADEHPTGLVYESQLFLSKRDAEGNLVWSRTYGDEILYLGCGVAQAPDGGYVLTGWEAKTIDDRDVILIKTDESGEVEWSRTWDLVPGERDGGFDLILTSDGYVVIACIQSMGSGAPSAVLIKVDLEGKEIWNKLIGEEGVGNTFWHIVEDPDGGYVMAGDTHLGQVPHTGQDLHGAWMVKTDPEGEILWQHVFGQGEYEQAHFFSAALRPAGGYLFVGEVTRNGGTYSDLMWMAMPSAPTMIATTPTELTARITATPTATATAPSALTLYPEPGTRIDARTCGGEHNDYLYDILVLADGGTLLAGQANNTGLSHRITPGNARLIRTDSVGNIIWQKDYGGENDANFYSLIQVGEDEYVALGSIAASYVRDETDFYLVKIDGEGYEIWSHTYGGRGMDPAKMVRQTSDGGFVLTGSRADEFPTGNQYEANIVLIKTDAEGNEIWTQTYGSKPLYLGWGVVQTPDGGYVLIGWEAKTYSDRDVIAIKTDAMGEVEWSRTWDLDPGDRDEGNDLILTSDGHIVIACIRSEDTGQRGAVLIKVDLEGNEIWTRQYGEEGVGNEFWDIMEDTDGGYVMAGSTIPGTVSSTGEDIRHGWVIKTDTDGEILWQHVFGIGEYEQEMFSSAAVLPEGGYIFVGRATRRGEKYADMLWLKLTVDGATALSADTAGVPTGTDTPGREAVSVDTADEVKLLSTLSGHSNRVYTVAFSGDGSHIASVSPDKTIRLWEVANGQEVHTFSIGEVGMNDIAFSPDGCLLASWEAIWDVESRRAVHTLDRGRLGPVAFSPDGSILAVAYFEKPIKFWDVVSGQVVRTLDDQAENTALSIEFSPDGALVAVGGHLNGTVTLWDVENGQIVRTLAHDARSNIHGVAFSPDGRLLASAATEGTVKIWDVASGQVVHTLQGTGCYDVTFSPDGSLLATAGCDRTVKLWDVASGQLVRSLSHADEVMAVAFSPDGTLLASGGYDSQVYLWGIPR